MACYWQLSLVPTYVKFFCRHYFQIEFNHPYISDTFTGDPFSLWILSIPHFTVAADTSSADLCLFLCPLHKTHKWHHKTTDSSFTLTTDTVHSICVKSKIKQCHTRQWRPRSEHGPGHHNKKKKQVQQMILRIIHTRYNENISRIPQDIGQTAPYQQNHNQESQEQS